MKTFIALVMIMILMISQPAFAENSVDGGPILKLNEYSFLYANESSFYIENGRVMVPVNLAEDFMGAIVDQINDEVTLSMSGNTVVLNLNSNIAMIDGKIVPMDNPMTLNVDTKIIYVPIRILIDSFGFAATWDNEWKQLYLEDARFLKTEKGLFMKEVDWESRSENIDNWSAFRVNSFNLDESIYVDESGVETHRGTIDIQIQNVTDELIPEGKQDFAYWIFTNGSIQTSGSGVRIYYEKRPEVKKDEIFNKELPFTFFASTGYKRIEYIIVWPKTLIKVKVDGNY